MVDATLAGGTWTATKSANAVGPSNLPKLACGGPASCVSVMLAGGSSTGELPYATRTWDGTAWHDGEVLTGDRVTGLQLQCPKANWCLMRLLGSTYDDGMAWTWDGSTWASIEPAAIRTDITADLPCDGPDGCLVVAGPPAARLDDLDALGA